MATPAIKPPITVAGQAEKTRSERAKSYWESPEGQRRKKEQAEKMAGNARAKKNGGSAASTTEKEKTSTPPPAEGEYLGSEKVKPTTDSEGNRVEPPIIKPISPEKFKRAWPKFLERLHRAFKRTFSLVEWGANLVVTRFFPEHKVTIILQDYTTADAALDAELTELLVEDNIQKWIAENRIKAAMIALFAWVVGGVDVKLEKKEKKNGDSAKPASGSGGGAPEALGTDGANPH